MNAYSMVIVSYVSKFSVICKHNIHDPHILLICVFTWEFCEGDAHTILFPSVRLTQAHPNYSQKAITLK